MATPRLVTTRYVEVGTYIGQFFIPGAGSLANDVRVPCIVAKGDRLFVVENLEMRRSFRFGEELTFSSVSPFVATLDYYSNGTKSLPVRLFTQNGIEVPNNKWEFLQDISDNYYQVQILDTAFDPTAQYYLDYQTTSRDIADPIPVVTINQLSVSAEIREVSALGLFQNQDEFKEYVDFFVEYEIDAVEADVGNANITRDFSAVNSASVVGTGTVAVSTSASYTHAYSRVYKLEVIAASGVTPTRLATLEWSSDPVSFGNAALPSTPISPVIPKPQILLDETNILSLSNIPLELGAIMDFDFGASNYQVGDIFYVQANGVGLVELDPLLTNTNQFTEFSAVQDTVDVLSTGTVAISSLPSAYTFTDYNTKFRMQCISVAGGIGSRVASFVWSMYGMTAASGSFTVSELVPGSEEQDLGATGITITLGFGANHFVVDDQFDWTVSAPRRFYKGKESVRNLTFSVSSVTDLADQAIYAGGFLSDTPEGKFGTWSADSAIDAGRFEINDGLRFYVRNTYLSSLVNPVPSGSRVQVGDLFYTQVRSLGIINFGLRQEVTEILSNPAEVSTDVTGAVTGVVGAKYVALDHFPSSIFAFRRLSNGDPLSYVQVPGTNFLRITEPGFGVATGDIEVIYQWEGPEPDPGQPYYLSGKFLRPAEMYNKPFLFLTPADAQRFLAPSTVRNDAYIGAEICFDYPIAGLFVIQVKDADDDGVYTKDDYRQGINAFLEDLRATDVVVLNSFQNIGDQLNVINRANDPFEKHESLTFIGAPIGTPIGSENEQGSLVFYSRRLLAVYGQSPAHGTRILVAPTRATRTITLEDKSSAEVTLDGSFVAAALAAKVASYTDPRATVLLDQLVSFDSIQTYTKEENAILGGNNIIYVKDEGPNAARIMEDVTTDPFSPDTLNLNQMTQKQFVTKDIRRTMTNAIISQVFPSPAAGIALIQDVLLNRLRTLVSRSLVGVYQDDQGGERSISGTDVIVTRDLADPTLYYIGYNYFLATVAKRLFGLFTVNLPGGFPR